MASTKTPMSSLSKKVPNFLYSVPIFSTTSRSSSFGRDGFSVSVAGASNHSRWWSLAGTTLRSVREQLRSHLELKSDGVAECKRGFFLQGQRKAAVASILVKERRENTFLMAAKIVSLTW